MTAGVTANIASPCIGAWQLMEDTISCHLSLLVLVQCAQVREACVT